MSRNFIRSFLPLFLISLAAAASSQDVKVVVVPLGDNSVDQCVVSSTCDTGAATLDCPGGNIAVPCATKKVFVTSGLYTGNLGGLSGADSICQGLANTANLGGVFKAWLSDTTGTPDTRFTKGPLPYALVNNDIVAADWDALTNTQFVPLVNSISIDENGETVNPIGGAWTNTGATGANEFGGSCNNWTSMAAAVDGVPIGWVGDITFTDLVWTDSNFRNCNLTARLYCFEQ